jgi:hypothetical protein
MTKHFSSIAFAAFVIVFALIWTPAAFAKQQCSAAKPSNPQGYWSWRMIDGRKCWYEGKPMLSRDLLEWPVLASARPVSNTEPASTPTKKPANPLDSQALVPTEPDTFEALWRARVEYR